MRNLRVGQKLIPSIVLLLISNMLSGYRLRDSWYMYFIYSIVFIVILVVLIKIKIQLPKTAISITLLIFSIPSLLDNNISNLTAFSMFLMAFWLSPKSSRIYMTYIALYFIAIIYKFNKVGALPSQITGYLGGVYAFGIIYEHYIHPKSKKQYIFSYVNLPVKKFLVDAMILYVQDKTWNEIAEKMARFKTGDGLRKEIKKEITKLGFKNYADFVLYLGQNGIIKQIDKNEITE